jgi:hypothetical protein
MLASETVLIGIVKRSHMISHSQHLLGEEDDLQFYAGSLWQRRFLPGLTRCNIES